MLRTNFVIFIWLISVTACQTSHQSNAGLVDSQSVDGFSSGSAETVSSLLDQNKARQKSLNLESKWLKLRSQVVEAEKYASECRISELELSAEMARFGAFDQRLPRGGFISQEQRTFWNAELEVKKTARITAEARANLLKRDLQDLRENIAQQGYQTPISSVFE